MKANTVKPCAGQANNSFVAADSDLRIALDYTVDDNDSRSGVFLTDSRGELGQSRDRGNSAA